jgi:hypothetical protein
MAAFATPALSPSQPPVVAAAPLAGAHLAPASPFVSPSDFIAPVARVVAPAPLPVTPNILVPAGTGGAAAAVIAVTPTTRGSFPWRRAIVPGLLVLVLGVLALRGGERNAALDRATPQRTAQQTVAPTIAPTVAPTIARTIAPTVAPTIAPTVAPTTAPMVAPSVAPTVAPTARPTPPAGADETGNTAATAAVIAAGTHEGAIAPVDDVDFFRVMVPDNTTIVLTLRADTLPGGGITIFNAAGTELEPEVNTGADRVARVEQVIRDPGAYFIRVRAARGAETTGTYTLDFSATR